MTLDEPKRRSAIKPAAGMQAGMLLRSLDASRMTARHVGLYLISALGHFFDGYDVQVIGVVLPTLTAYYKLSPDQSGALASSSGFGMFFGALVVGFISDRLGRKASLMIALGIFSVFSLLCA